ncbi:MAG: thiamine biosynthesis lipoprotein [Myxococcota bacterium]|jgi:thiamine biosynthesis lipoprotein
MRWCIAAGLLLVAGCQATRAAPVEAPTLVTRSTALMGTSVELLIAAEDGPAVQRALDEAVGEIARIEDLLTTWRPDSKVAELNRRAGEWVVLPDEVLAVLEASRELCDRTGGAFDPTFASMRKVWDFRSAGPVPSPEVAREAAAAIDCTKLDVDRSRKSARIGPGQAVATGGIGKGYAVDRAADVLRARGFTNFVVNAGGDLRASGRYRGNLWRVGIRHPRKEGIELAILPISGYAVATSGDYERYFDQDGVRYHHILDPKTGYPAPGCQSVTVMAQTTTVADALATGIFVLGPVEGLALAERLPGVEALIVGADGQLSATTGMTAPRS